VQKHNVTKNKKKTEKITGKQESHARLTPFGQNIHIGGLHLNISLLHSDLAEAHKTLLALRKC